MSDNRSHSEPENANVRSGNDSNLDNDSGHPNETGPPTQEQTKESSQPSLDASNSNVRSKLQTGWRRIIRNFTPSWFSVTMGTGITSILLHNLPYNGVWLHDISYILFALNVLLFTIFSLISVLRYTLYPEIWHAMIQHPAQSLFIGTFPMGLATIVNMVAFVCVPAWGGATWKLAWALWWIDSGLAMATCCYLPFVLMAHHNHNLTTVSAVWLLPIVSTIVAAASGGVVASVIPSTHSHEALITLITSYVLWGTGFPLAMCVLVIYFLRLSTQSLPAKEVIVSTFLPLGPLGQGGFGIMQLGKVAMTAFRETDSLPAASHVLPPGEVLYTVGFLVALFLWGFGLVWLFFAVATVYRTPKFPFNMGWWGFTFPLGVYATSTTMLGSELPSAFFRVLGTIFSVAVTLLWIVVSCGTLQRAWTGEMFFAPCLKDLEQKGTGRETKDV
ncbi:putative C4-dicarboxylate transporter/malic acid transport protein [Hortaea werneckii]|nr:putative C4-dicarboxylate transporter/malic acid transport protein [Hortaea werneckii]KAI7333522.1 putative C4-dicarboxylate transporter/malic acid transport protein [Hortaea werneckii]